MNSLSSSNETTPVESSELWEQCGKAALAYTRDQERQVKKLQGQLRQLDNKRAIIKAKLDEIMREHIAVNKVEVPPNAVGDAALFNTWTKAKLMQMIEEHWRIHHMAAIEMFDGYTRDQLINYFIDIKGLAGHYEKKPAKRKGGGRKSDDLAF